MKDKTKNKRKDLLKNLVSRSLPVSRQTFDLVKNPQQESDQYIVDGPALRELLRAYRWNYKTIKKHRDWVPTFHLNGTEEDHVELASHKITEDPTAPWSTRKTLLIIAGAFLLIVMLIVLAPFL